MHFLVTTLQVNLIAKKNMDAL